MFSLAYATPPWLQLEDRYRAQHPGGPQPQFGSLVGCLKGPDVDLCVRSCYI